VKQAAISLDDYPSLADAAGIANPTMSGPVIAYLISRLEPVTGQNGRRRRPPCPQIELASSYLMTVADAGRRCHACACSNFQNAEASG